MPEDKYPIRIPMTEVLRDFLIHRYGETLDITIDSSRLSKRENIMLTFLEECTNKTFTRTEKNSIDSRLTAEYIIICDKPSLTKFQKHKIKNVLHDYLKYTLFAHMAVSNECNVYRRVRLFIESHNIFAENAELNIMQIVQNSEFYKKSKRA